MKIDKEEWYKLNHIIQILYGCNAQTVLPEVCTAIRALVPYDKAFTNLASNKNNIIVYYDYRSIDVENEYLESYINHYIDVDYCTWYTAQPKALVYKDTQLIYEQRRMESVFYKEWLEPQGIHYAGGVSISCNGIAYGDMTLMRSETSEDFSDKELEILSVLCEHISRFFMTKYPKGINKSLIDKEITDLQIKYNLTEKENEIIQYIKQGTDLKELGSILFVSENTIKKHMANIYTKLDVQNRTQFLRRVFTNE